MTEEKPGEYLVRMFCDNCRNIWFIGVEKGKLKPVSIECPSCGCKKGR